MDDLIPRKAAIDAVYYKPSHKMAIEVLKEVPAVDAVPVVHGRWVDENPDDFLDPRMRCSVCAEVESPLIKWRYCPNCGAKMDNEGE